MPGDIEQRVAKHYARIGLEQTILAAVARTGVDTKRKGAGDLAFPVPWSETPETSFVASPAEYRQALEGAGFDVVKLRDRTDFAFDFFRDMAAKAAATGGPPPVGIHLLMGGNAKAKLDNVIASLERGLIAPTEIIARAR